MNFPVPVQNLIDSISELPGVVACFCAPKRLGDLELSDLSLPGDFAELPHAAIRRTEGGLQNEVMIQTEVILDRSAEAWLSIEFLAWWVRDWSRSGHRIQIRPTALPPKASEIQLGRTLKFLIEYFVIENGDGFATTLEVAGTMAESIASCFADSQDCFANPTEFTGEVEDI